MSDIKLKSFIHSFLVVSVLLLGGCLGQEEANHQSHTTSSETPSYKRIFDPPKEAYAFNLTDQFGQRKGLNDWKGKIVVLGDIYTRCPVACPILARCFVEIQDELGEMLFDQVVLVFVTVDPEYDTPEKLATWTNAFNGKWVALTGTLEECEEVWNNYGIVVYGESGEIGHSAKFTLIDQQGMIRFDYYYPPESEQILNDIYALMGTVARL
ncbi:MAG: SCO family protein [Candidatus Heimdallarchaeota archaeon]